MLQNIKRSPSILSSFNIRQSLYLNDFKSGMAASNIKYSNGGAVRVNLNEVIKASLGEHLERIASVKNYKKPTIDDDNPTMPGFNLITGEVVNLPAEKLLINFDLPVFKFTSNKEQLFNDSCGLASHVNSINAIKGGFKEFLERQSLIYNWLSALPGKQIKLTDVIEINNNKNFTKLLNIALSYSEKIYLFDISIINGFYVVLTIGQKGYAFSSGLGADTNLLNAIESSLSEYLMILDSCIINKLNSNKYRSGDSNVYTDYFFSLNVDQFFDQFSYLLNQSEFMDIKQNETEINWRELVRNTHKKFNINLYACYMPFPLRNINVKVVKILSPEAYPHIWTKIFDPLDFEISKSLPYTSFPNKFQPIPFA